MKRHIVLEIDEGSIRCTAAVVRRRGVVIESTRRAELGALDSTDLSAHVHRVLEDIDTRASAIHIALSDPRFVHFSVHVPKLADSELDALLEREARRLDSSPGDVPLRVGHIRLGRNRNGTWRHSVVAVQASAIQPILDAVRREGLEVDMVTSIEEAALRSLPRELPDSTVFLDYHSGRVSFIHVERGVATQRRHILLPAFEGSKELRQHHLDQLSSEVAWNIDYLVEMGKPAPRAIVISPSLTSDEVEARRLAGDLPLFAPQPLKLASDKIGYGEPDAPLGLATTGLLASAASSSGGLTVVKSARAISRSMHSKRLAMASCIAVGIIALSSAGWIAREMSGVVQETENVRLQLVDAQDRLAQKLVDPERRELVTLERQVEKILATRKPTSLFFSKVCNLVPVGIELVSINTNEDGIVVLGRARNSDNASSLQLVQEFRTAVQQLAFLEHVRERVEKYDGSQEWLTFQVEAEWRYKQ